MKKPFDVRGLACKHLLGVKVVRCKKKMVQNFFGIKVPGEKQLFAVKGSRFKTLCCNQRISGAKTVRCKSGLV